MDVIVCYFHEDRVVTQYFDSQFMGHTTADKLVENLKSSLAKLSNRKLLQLSMDGPRVNWKVLSLLCEDRDKQDADLPKLLNIGSCGLHIVHGAFCTGCQATEWKIDGVLKTLCICSMIHLQEKMTSNKLLGQHSSLLNSVQPDE